MTVASPRISRRRAAITVAVGVLPVGILVGGLWSWLAPPLHGVVALTHDGQRLHDYLGGEADHFFVAAFLMLGLLNVLAAVTAVLAWQWRSHRGPAMVAGLCVGVVIAAAAALAVGVFVAHLRYGTVNVAAVPVSHEHPIFYLTEAPPAFFGASRMQMACTLLLPAATAALVYAAPAAATARDDLGSDPALDTAPPPADSS